MVSSGYNPVKGVMEKPVGDPDEAAWLEVSDAALLLESARGPTAQAPTRTQRPFTH